MEVEYKTSFIDPGYYAYFFGKDISNNVQINGEVNSEQLNDYIITYKAHYGFINNKVTRHVKVVDKEKPSIVLKGEQTVSVCPNQNYQEEGYEAIDNYDGNLTDKVIITNLDDGIVYRVNDSSNNFFEIKRTIIKQDIEKPSITLKGLDAVYVALGSTYNEPGYETKDNCGNVTVTVKGIVDTTKKGTYTLEYIATDENGNTTTIERKVIVYENLPTGNGKAGVIYLTFDDGPRNGTTDKILDILKEEDVKATFFVTNQYGNTDYLLKREFNEGHTIGLHTASHMYSKVYASVDAYYNDLYAIQKRVKDVTGYESFIIRFPGGSSNTVSRNYSKGIMSFLTKDVITKGFHYFDWNVASQDTSCTTSNCVYNSVIRGLSQKRGNYVLMHDVKNTTVGALKDIIAYGKANGYRFEAITMETEMNHHGVNN